MGGCKGKRVHRQDTKRMEDQKDSGQESQRAQWWKGKGVRVYNIGRA